MRLFKYLLPFAIIALAYLAFPHLLAKSSRLELMTFNQPQHGALILNARQTNESGENLQGCDIYFAGTSRTMADYDPSLFAQAIASQLGLSETPCAINLGNVGNSPLLLEGIFARSQFSPKLLILEFSPHIFYIANSTPQERSAFEQHQLKKQWLELTVAGQLRQFLHLQSTLSVDPAAIYLFAQKAASGQTEVGALYAYLAINSFGSGQSYQPDGQVHYREYLNGPEAVQSISDWADTTYNDFEQQYSGRPMNQDAWESYHRILVSLGPDKVVVVRPPVSNKLYAWENQELSTGIERLLAAVKELNITYVDLNPHPFHSLDESHVDWYDSPLVTEALAYELEAWLRANYSR